MHVGSHHQRDSPGGGGVALGRHPRRGAEKDVVRDGQMDLSAPGDRLQSAQFVVGEGSIASGVEAQSGGGDNDERKSDQVMKARVFRIVGH